LFPNFHNLIIFYDPKFIKLKPATKKIPSQIKPLIKKKANPPKRKYLPHLLFDKKLFILDIKDMD
tara:strand:- start:312 stop:506 length:195 start_codon:yes stop_codon:yes gene_type:complete